MSTTDFEVLTTPALGIRPEDVESQARQVARYALIRIRELIGQVDEQQELKDNARKECVAAVHTADTLRTQIDRLQEYVSELKAEIVRLRNPPPAGRSFTIEHDGFSGTVQGHYLTREGKAGVVLQQHGTRVVHVYGEKWLTYHPQPGDTVKIRAKPSTAESVAPELEWNVHYVNAGQAVVSNRLQGQFTLNIHLYDWEKIS